MRHFLAVVAALAFHAAAQAQDNLQNLLAALTQGSEVTLITPLANGMAQVTSFRPAARLSSADAVAAIGSLPGQGSGQFSPGQLAQALHLANQQLASLGIANPTPEQISIALSGGVLTTPMGAVNLHGVLAAGAPSSAAAGGTAPGFSSQTPGFSSQVPSFSSQTPGFSPDPFGYPQNRR